MSTGDTPSSWFKVFSQTYALTGDVDLAIEAVFETKLPELPARATLDTMRVSIARFNKHQVSVLVLDGPYVRKARVYDYSSN